MATIKSYTDINQSHKLAEILLPIESADMYYYDNLPIPKVGYSREVEKLYNKTNIDYFPCWSLAALLGILPKYELNNFGDTIQLDVGLEALATEGDETLLDLVVNMIIHLHELKML